MADTVLLTGISGYLAGHVALQLLAAGYRVRGSVRSLDKADKVRATLAANGADISQLEFVSLDLGRDTGWTEAMQGVRYLQHTASPFVVQMPKDRNELVGPAVAGTERAINAALSAGVEHIVLTSSFAAIGYGHDAARTTPFTAADWTDLEGRGINAYVESKTRAERRAWELVDAAGRHDALTTINPTAILGPVLDEDPGTSVSLIVRLLGGTVPAAPRIGFIVTDVRDVAAAHLAAMTEPAAAGHRIPIGERPMRIFEIARLVRGRFPQFAGRLPRFEVPDWIVRIAAVFDADIRGNLGELGVTKTLDASPATSLLGRPLIAADTTLLDTVQSLIDHRIVKP